jgi:hypothetical protein
MTPSKMMIPIVSPISAPCLQFDHRRSRRPERQIGDTLVSDQVRTTTREVLPGHQIQRPLSLHG